MASDGGRPDVRDSRATRATRTAGRREPPDGDEPEGDQPYSSEASWLWPMPTGWLVDVLVHGARPPLSMALRAWCLSRGFVAVSLNPVIRPRLGQELRRAEEGQ